jgi:hypothetical protein
MQTRLQKRTVAGRLREDDAHMVLEPLAAFLLADAGRKHEDYNRIVMPSLRLACKTLRELVDSGWRLFCMSGHPTGADVSALEVAALPRLLSRRSGLRVLSARLPVPSPPSVQQRVAEGFAEGVRGLRSLRSLRLSGHAPSELLSEALCDALRASCASVLMELRLEDRLEWSAADAQRVVSAMALLPPMPALAVLSVDCGGGPHAVVAAARLVAAGRCPRLRSLKLGGSRIDAGQLSCIADALTRPSVAATLTELKLTFACTRVGADRVLGALGALAQLQTLDLALFLVGHSLDVRALTRALGALSALKSLSLHIRAFVDNAAYIMCPAEIAAVVKALPCSCTTLKLVVSGVPTREAATAAASAAVASYDAALAQEQERPLSVRTLTLVVTSSIEHCWFDPAFFMRMLSHAELQALKIVGASTAINVDARSLPDGRAQLPRLQLLGLQNVRLV